MKKILIMVVLSFAICSTAFATSSSPSATITMSTAIVVTNTGLSLYGGIAGFTYSAGVTPLIGKTSTGVAVGVSTSTTGYCLLTQHISGTKEFGSSFDSTSIYQVQLTGAAGAPFLAQPNAANSTDFSTTGWTAM